MMAVKMQSQTSFTEAPINAHVESYLAIRKALAYTANLIGHALQTSGEPFSPVNLKDTTQDTTQEMYYGKEMSVTHHIPPGTDLEMS